jgi:4-hydroxybutyrate dehydrogenase/sulfolactaldehyde 3-reductase
VPNIAFIGLGAMGVPIASNIASAGNKLSVFDISEAACSKLAALGARVGTDAADAARGCDYAITMLPTSVEVRDSLLGPNGACAGLNAGAMVIDMTTGSVGDFFKLRLDLQKLGFRLVDSPVGRGSDEAAARKILFMSGGSDEEIAEITPLLAPLCEELIHCGPAGNGLKTKIINNYLATVSVVATAEALALADAAGLDRNFLTTLWTRTVAGRGALATVYPQKAFAGDFTPGFSARLARKDLKLALEFSEQYGIPLSTGAAARQVFSLQQAQGRLDEDWTAILDVLTKLAEKPA